MKKTVVAAATLLASLGFAPSAEAGPYTGPDNCYNIPGKQSGHEWWLRDLNQDGRCQVFMKYEGWVFPDYSPRTAPTPFSVTVVPCKTDEAGDPRKRPCVWDARHQGNGRGQSFIVWRNGSVKEISHTRAHYLWAN